MNKRWERLTYWWSDNWLSATLALAAGLTLEASAYLAPGFEPYQLGLVAAGGLLGVWLGLNVKDGAARMFPNAPDRYAEWLPLAKKLVSEMRPDEVRRLREFMGWPGDRE